jgi:beta-1,4-mannosyltransferase
LAALITLQPYVPLYKEALERQGLVVQLEREFNLKWLLTEGRSCDAIHLQFIVQTYVPLEPDIRSERIRRLLNSRWIRPVRGAIVLARFSAVLLLAKLQGKVFVYTVHNLTPHHKQSWPFAILRRMAHWVVLSLADQVHAHNHYSRQTLETVHGRKNAVRVIPIGNYVGFYPNEISQLDARQQLGLPEDAFVYLFLGMIRPYKGVEDLVVAFEELDSPDSRLLIVGRVSMGSRNIPSLGQNNPAIKLVPEFVPNEAIQLYMNACNVCVLPYRYVTTSSAVMLAWTFGRPVVAPAIGPFPESVTLETGVLYDPSQTNGLASALRQARERSWSESEILDYVHRFDWDKLGPELASLYQMEYGRQR